MDMLKVILMSESVSCWFRFSTSHAKNFINSAIKCFSPIYGLHYNTYLILSFLEHESDVLILACRLFQIISLEYFTYKDPILWFTSPFCLFNFLAMCHFSSLSIIEFWSILVYMLHELTFGLPCMPNLEKCHVSCMSEAWHHWLEGKHFGFQLTLMNESSMLYQKK